MSSKHDTAVSVQQARSGEEERNFRAPKASKRHFTPAPRELAVARRVIESQAIQSAIHSGSRSPSEQSQSAGSPPERRRHREIRETVR